MGSNSAADFIKVAVRIRPKIKREIKKGQNDCWGYSGNEVFQLDENGRTSQECFTFDYVFGTESKNTDMYKIVRPIVQQATQGINGTVFAYGQTSSGKTHSIMGNEEDIGIIPQAINDIFSHIENNNNNRKFLIRASYIEIYNEKINDLLNTSAKDLKIREDFAGNVGVKATEEIARTREELLSVVHEGNKKRQIGETNMNDRSSRSHVIFQIIIESSEQVDGDNQDTPVQVSSLYLVDLAGSERVAQTKATGARLIEGGHINKSLSVLSLVMQQLSLKKEHISFRDSKLTRILSNALGGNSKTLIIATITPVSIENTLSTLMFAKCAKTIMNQPHVNEILTEAALIKQHQQKEKMLLRELQNEKEKNITLQKDKHVQGERIRSLEEKLKNIRCDFVNIKPVPVSKIPKRRHTSAFERPRQEPLITETARLTTIFDVDVLNEEDNIERSKTPELVDNSIEIPSTPVTVLKARLESLNESHVILKEFQSDELRVTLQHEQELAVELEKLKNELKTAEEARKTSEKLMKEFQDKYEKRDVTCSEVEIQLSFLSKKYANREQELLGKLAEQTELNERYKELENEMYAMSREREYMTEIKRCANDFKLKLEDLEKESTDLKEQRDRLAQDYAELKEEHVITVSKKQLFMKQVEFLTRGVYNGGREGMQRTSSDSAIYKKSEAQAYSKNKLFEHKNDSSLGNELIEEVKQDLCSLETIISSRSNEEVSSPVFHIQGNGDNISICEDLKLMKEKCKKVRNSSSFEDFDYFRTINERYMLECQRLEGVIKELDLKVKVKDQEIINLHSTIKEDQISKTEILEQVEKYQLVSKQYHELLKQNNEMTLNLQKLSEEVNDKDADIDRLKQETNFMKRTVNENGLALEEANAKISAITSTLQSKEEELVHLKRRLRQSDESKEKAEKEMLKRFKLKLDEARNEIDEVSNDLMDKISVIEQLETSLAKSQEELKVSERNFILLQQELENIKKQEVNREEILRLQDDLKLSREDLHKSRVEIENFKNLQNTWNDKEVALSEQIKILQDQNEIKAKEEKDRILQENRSVVEKESLLKQEVETLRVLEETVQKKDRDLKVLEQNLFENRKRLEETENHKDEQKQELEIKNKTLIELEEKLQEMAKILQEKEGLVKEVRREKDDIFQESKRLVEKEMLLRQEVETLRVLEETVTNKDHDLKVLEQNLFESRKRLEETEHDKDEQKRELENKDKTLIELEKKLLEKDELIKETLREKCVILEKETLRQEVESVRDLKEIVKKNDHELKVLSQRLLKGQELLEEMKTQNDLKLNELKRECQERLEIKDKALIELEQKIQEMEGLVRKEKDDVLQKLELKMQENNSLVEKETLLRQEVETLNEKLCVLEKNLQESDDNLRERNLLQENIENKNKLLLELEIKLQEEAKISQKKDELLKKVESEKGNILQELERKIKENENLLEKEILLRREVEALIEKNRVMEETLEENNANLKALDERNKETQDEKDMALQEIQELLEKIQEKDKIVLDLQQKFARTLEQETIEEKEAMEQKLLEYQDLLKNKEEVIEKIKAEKEDILQKTLEEKDKVLLKLEQKEKAIYDLVNKETLLKDQTNTIKKSLEQKLLQNQEQEVRVKELQVKHEKMVKGFEQTLQKNQEVLKEKDTKLLQLEESVSKYQELNQKLREELCELEQRLEKSWNLLDENVEELKHTRKAQSDLSIIQEINKKLLKDVEEKNNELESYKDANKKLSANVLALEPYFDMNVQLMEKIRHLQEVEAEQRKTREANLELQRQLFMYSQEINQLNVRIMQLSNKSTRETELTKKCNELVQTNTNLRQQVQSGNEKIAEVKRDLERARAELQTVIKDRAVLKESHARTVLKKEGVEKRLEEVVIEKRSLNERVNELELMKKGENEKVVALEKHLIHMRDEAKQLKIEMENLEMSREQLKIEMEKLETSKEELKTEISEQMEVMSDYERYLMNVIEGKFEACKPSQNENASMPRRKLEKIVTKLIETLQRKERNLNSSTGNETIETLKEELKTKQEELSQLKDDNETLDLEVVGFQEIVERNKKEITELEAKIEELKAENEHLDREVLGALDVIKGLENAHSKLTKEIQQKDDLINKLKKNKDLNVNKGCTNCIALRFRLNSMEKLKLQSEVEDCAECRKLQQKNKELHAKFADLQEDFERARKSKEHKELQECQRIVHTEISQSIQRVHDLLSLLRQTKELSGCDCCNSFMRLLAQFNNEINGLRSMPEDLQSVNNTYNENEQRLINLLLKVIETPNIQGIEDIRQQLKEELTRRQTDLKSYKKIDNLRKVFLTEVLYIMNNRESSFKTFYNRLQSNVSDRTSGCPSCPRSKKFCELIFKIKERVTSTIPIIEQTNLPLSSLEYWQSIFALQDRYIIPLQEELSPFQFVETKKCNEQTLTDLENLRAKYKSLSAVAVMRMEKLKTVVQHFEKEGFKVLNLDQKPGDIKISRNPLKSNSPNESAPPPRFFGSGFSLEDARKLGNSAFPFPSKFIKPEQMSASNVKPLSLSDQVKSRRAGYQLSYADNASDVN